MDPLLKSGEFAQLCRTTKETLRHYAKIDLSDGIYVVNLNGYIVQSAQRIGITTTRLPSLLIMLLFQHFKVRVCHSVRFELI